MSVTAAIVLYAVTWFMSLFIVLPIRLKTQGDTGEIIAGTPAGAPVNAMIKKRLLWTTIVATPIWAILAAIIIQGVIGVEDLRTLGEMAVPAQD